MRLGCEKGDKHTYMMTIAAFYKDCAAGNLRLHSDRASWLLQCTWLLPLSSLKVKLCIIGKTNWLQEILKHLRLLKAVAWLSADTFIKHHSVDNNTRRETSVRTAGFHLVFQWIAHPTASSDSWIVSHIGLHRKTMMKTVLHSPVTVVLWVVSVQAHIPAPCPAVSYFSTFFGP